MSILEYLGIHGHRATRSKVSRPVDLLEPARAFIPWGPVMTDLSPAVEATLALRAYECTAVLDAAPWRCGAPTPGIEDPWCPHHRALYCVRPEPSPRRHKRPSYR